MRIAELAALGVFTAWAALCILVYVPRFRGGIRNRDFFSLVPEWRFFGPRPGEHDFTLLYRDTDPNEGSSAWHEVFISPPRRWWNCVWNPGKRGNKALFDVIVELARHISEKDPAIELSIPYITLVNTVSSLPRLTQPRQTEFLILMQSATEADTPPEVLFVSTPHEVEP